MTLNEHLVYLAAVEVAGMEVPFVVRMSPLDAVHVAGLLQLASRHPGVSPAHHAALRRFLDDARVYFADAPTILAVLDAGDDPAQDV